MFSPDVQGITVCILNKDVAKKEKMLQEMMQLLGEHFGRRITIRFCTLEQLLCSNPSTSTGDKNAR